MKSITLASQNFTKRVSRAKLPYIDQVSGFYLFGGNAASSLPNLAYGASQNLSLIGTPTYGTGYAVIDTTKGFETGFLMDTPFTMMAVVYIPAATSVLAVYGRGAGNSDNFVDMLTWDTTNNGTVAGYPDGNLQDQMINRGAGGFQLIGHSWGGTGTRHACYIMQGNTFTDQTSSNSITKTVTPTHTLKIGTGYGSGTPATQIAAGILAPSILSVEQMYRMGLYLRALLATRGVTML